MEEPSNTATTLSERLNIALDKLNVNRAELARRIGVQQPVIQYLCCSNAKKSKFTLEIADALGISSSWLAVGEGTMTIKVSSYQQIPMIPWKKIFDYSINRYNIIDNDEISYIQGDANLNDSLFAFRLNDQSMYPKFDIETIIIINQHRQPENGNYILVHIESLESILFRQLLIYNDNKKIISPLNKSVYKSFSLADEDQIIGVMEEARWQQL